jgi:chemotaxis protein MotA
MPVEERKVLIIVGFIMVVGCVFGGYLIAGGHLMALVEPAAIEMLIIGGGALGAFIAANSMTTAKAAMAASLALLKAPRFGREEYIQLLKLLYELLMKMRKDGQMAIESHVDSPADSPIFQKYPKVLADHHLVDFMTDCLRLMIGGNMAAHELEAVLEAELETHHHEAAAPAHALQKVADALPAFGIVAAVLGIVKVMSVVGSAPPSVVGAKVAAALVGTFLGILLGYGFVGPLAAAMEQRAHEDAKPLDIVKIALLSTVRGYAPQVALEFARKQLLSGIRPSFADLESELKAAR